MVKVVGIVLYVFVFSVVGPALTTTVAGASPVTCGQVGAVNARSIVPCPAECWVELAGENVKRSYVKLAEQLLNVQAVIFEKAILAWMAIINRFYHQAGHDRESVVHMNFCI